jgi:TLD
MGNASSSSSKSPAVTREQEDLKFLGERFAFGDAELWHLYHAHCAIFHHHHPHEDNGNNQGSNSKCNISSFLSDWAIQSTLILEQQERLRQQKEDQQQRLKRVQQQQRQERDDEKHGRGGGGGVHHPKQEQVVDENESASLFFLSRMSNDEFQNCHLPSLQQERRSSLNVVERHILPIDLGNRLYRAACVVPDDVAAMNLYAAPAYFSSSQQEEENKNNGSSGSSSSSKPQNSASSSKPSRVQNKIITTTVDEYTRRARLTRLFEGFSNMGGRRGARATLQVMFQACRYQKQRKKKRSNSSYPYGDTGSTTATQKITTVSALEMIDMGYRLALAAEYLQQRHDNFHSGLRKKDSTQQKDAEEQTKNINTDTDDSDNNNNNNKKVIDEQGADSHDHDDGDDDDIMAMDVASLLPPPPSHWSLDDVLLSSSTRNRSSAANNKEGMLNSSLRALARSMIEKGKRRQERTDNGGDGLMFDFSPPQDYAQSDPKTIDNDNDDHYDYDDGFVELDDIVEWTEEVAPLFASTLPTLLHRILFPGRPYPPQQTPFSYPRILQESSFFVGSSSSTITTTTTKNDTDDANTYAPVGAVVVNANASPLLFGLACFSSSLSGLYFRLYTSASDGLSFNRLQNALLGYGGPTCIIIRAVVDEYDDNDDMDHDDADHYTEGGIFGAVSASPWKESKDFYGTSDCFLFQLSPITAVYRPTSVARNVDSSSKNYTTTHKGTTATGKTKSSGPNYMYCNPSARSKGYDGLAHGIGFGGTVDQPRLFLDETLEQCYAGSQDWTFENGALLPPSNNRRKQYFQVDSLEVWGVGGTALVEKALDARQLARDVRQEGIRRARKVDKAQFLDDFRSGLIDSKLLAHRQQIDGRADQDCRERHAQAFGHHEE